MQNAKFIFKFKLISLLRYCASNCPSNLFGKSSYVIVALKLQRLGKDINEKEIKKANVDGRQISENLEAV